MTMLTESVIEQNGTQVLVISPAERGTRDDYSAVLHARVAEAKAQFGGVLLRGFDPLTAEGFNRFVGACGRPLLNYEFGSTPRRHIEKGIYSSTEYPADQWIDQHNEQSYTLKWPESIWFYCDIAAAEGGATPIADSRLVYQRLDPALRRHFAARQIMYVRNYGNGLDVPWEQVFGTDDRREVERYCHAHEIAYEWLDDGDAQDGIDREGSAAGHLLRTRQLCQSELRHPRTGEVVWFNQAHLFHVSNLPAAVQEALLEVVDEDRLPRNTYFGDGTPIDPAMLAEIRSVYDKTMLSFDWRLADTLVLDNVLMSHGRAPFAGQRRVFVAMTG